MASCQDWPSLTESVLAEIFQHLGARALLDARLACGHWRRCVDHSQVTRLCPSDALLYGKAIRKFPMLQSLHLTRCQDKVSDSFLLALASKLRVHCPRLRELSLQNCHLVSSKGVEAVASQLPQLTSLNLSGCRQTVPVTPTVVITSWGYAGVDGRGLPLLPRLQHLDLSWSAVDDSSIPLLLPLTHLRTLHLHNCNLSDAGVEKLSALSSLTSLGLGGSSVGTGGLRVLRHLPLLLHLDLHGCKQLSAAGLQPLAGCTALQTISLAHCCQGPLPPPTLLPIALLPALKSLDLSGCSAFSPRHLAPFRNHAHLRRLSLQNCNWVDDEALQEVARLPHLQALLLSNCCKITHEGLQLLAAALKLRELDLSLTRGGQPALQVVASMPALTCLDISYCQQVGREGLAQLAAAGQLEQLRMRGCRCIGDEEVAALKLLGSKLRLLQLQGCNGITDAGLHLLSTHMTRLQHLDVSYCWGLTDSGVPPLARLPHLASFTFEACRHITPASLTVLRHVLCTPNLLSPPHPRQPLPACAAPSRPVPRPPPRPLALHTGPSPLPTPPTHHAADPPGVCRRPPPTVAPDAEC